MTFSDERCAGMPIPTPSMMVYSRDHGNLVEKPLVHLLLSVGEGRIWGMVRAGESLECLMSSFMYLQMRLTKTETVQETQKVASHWI